MFHNKRAANAGVMRACRQFVSGDAENAKAALENALGKKKNDCFTTSTLGNRWWDCVHKIL